MTGSELITKRPSSGLLPCMPDHLSSSSPIFILCDKCYWCATYVDSRRIPAGNICPQCNTNSNELTSFAIMPNESFTFDFNNNRGIELEFRSRRKDNGIYRSQEREEELDKN
jgi:hypothetical protein